MSARPRGEARRRRAFAGAAWRWDRPRAGYGVCQRPRHPAAAVTGGVEAAGERPDRSRQPACRERPVLGSGSAAGSWLLAVPHEGWSCPSLSPDWARSPRRRPASQPAALVGSTPRRLRVQEARVRAWGPWRVSLTVFLVSRPVRPPQPILRTMRPLLWQRKLRPPPREGTLRPSPRSRPAAAFSDILRNRIALC